MKQPSYATNEKQVAAAVTGFAHTNKNRLPIYRPEAVIWSKSELSRTCMSGASRVLRYARTREDTLSISSLDSLFEHAEHGFNRVAAICGASVVNYEWGLSETPWPWQNLGLVASVAVIPNTTKINLQDEAILERTLAEQYQMDAAGACCAWSELSVDQIVESPRGRFLVDIEPMGDIRQCE